MSPQKRVLLVWPVFQALYPRPFETFAQIAIAAGRQTNYLFGVKVFERQSLVTAMNSIGDLVLAQREWDAVIVFDDDCFPPVDVIPRLLTRCFDEGHPFVAAAGIMRGFPFTTTVARWYPEGVTARRGAKVTMSGFEWLDDLPAALVDADFCGVPAAIIHRRVFEAIRSPWFGDHDAQGERMTHDVYFCQKMQDAKIPIKVDGTIRCGHLIDAPIITFENRGTERTAAGVA